MPLVLLILIKNPTWYTPHLIVGVYHPHLVPKSCVLRKHNNYANGLTIISLVYK